ncbi:hypothetical protein DsansV1_C34g0227021 [Dioscorea sansibarensis]
MKSYKQISYTHGPAFWIPNLNVATNFFNPHTYIVKELIKSFVVKKIRSKYKTKAAPEKGHAEGKQDGHIEPSLSGLLSHGGCVEQIKGSHPLFGPRDRITSLNLVFLAWIAQRPKDLSAEAISGGRRSPKRRLIPASAVINEEEDQKEKKGSPLRHLREVSKNRGRSESATYIRSIIYLKHG